jgi:hypothetical protein
MQGTVHLYIESRTASYKITFMPLEIKHKVYTYHRMTLSFSLSDLDNTFLLYSLPMLLR